MMNPPPDMKGYVKDKKTGYYLCLIAGHSIALNPEAQFLNLKGSRDGARVCTWAEYEEMKRDWKGIEIEWEDL